MPAPDEIVAAYQRQSRRRLRWCAISVAVGLAAAAAWKLSGLNLEAWKPSLIAGSLVFWPFFFWQVRRKDFVSTREVWRARRELLDRRRER